MSNSNMMIINQLTKHIDSNRNKIETALVSLRFVKEIDVFLYNNNLTQKEFADKMNVSGSYISQLMTGTKRINMEFIKNFEKYFNIEFKISLTSVNSEYSIIEMVNNPIQLKSNREQFSVFEDYSFSNKSDFVYLLNEDSHSFLIDK